MDISTVAIIIGGLLAVSEMLALIPSVRSNSVFQMIWNTLQILAGRKED